MIFSNFAGLEALPPVALLHEPETLKNVGILLKHAGDLDGDIENAMRALVFLGIRRHGGSGFWPSRGNVN